MKKKPVIAIAMFLLALLVTGTLWITSEKKAASERAACLSILRSTGAALSLYRQDNNGELPPDFSLLGKGGYLNDARWFVHRGAEKKRPNAWENIEDWMDYVYLPWPNAAGVYAKYPLMYDRRLSNHGGAGVNVLLVEQTERPATPNPPKSFHGQFFWDKNAQWLRNFAKEHPERPVPLPEN